MAKRFADASGYGGKKVKVECSAVYGVGEICADVRTTVRGVVVSVSSTQRKAGNFEGELTGCKEVV